MRPMENPPNCDPLECCHETDQNILTPIRFSNFVSVNIINTYELLSALHGLQFAVNRVIHCVTRLESLVYSSLVLIVCYHLFS